MNVLKGVGGEGEIKRRVREGETETLLLLLDQLISSREVAS